jgi:hypothetical protein
MLKQKQMDELKGRAVLKRLRSKWMLVVVSGDALTATGTSFLLVLLLHRLGNVSYYWFMAFFAAIFAGLFVVHRVWKLKEAGIAQLLDETYPELEESTGLLLRPFASLNSLETRQCKKVNENLLALSSPLRLSKKLIVPLSIVAISLFAGIALQLSAYQPGVYSTKLAAPPPAAQPEKLLPQLARINLIIQPPAYTGKHEKKQHAFNIIAEEGSWVSWQLETNLAAEKVIFIFNDSIHVALQAKDRGGTDWQFTKKMDSSAFYQLSIDGKLSAFYKIETIKDASPVISVLSPKQYTTIDIGTAPQVRLNTTIHDDYSIADAAITATIASGNGEAVKFKEQRIPLSGFIAGNTAYQLQQWLSLPALAMQPGDELYFYIHATDNHQQQSRSDIYIVHLPDTAQLMSLEGLVNSVTLKPEYFRSQRQIIIETEQLLKEKDTISPEAFKNRSNNLGIDQKLLRLRYSKFLGEETETGETNIDEVAGINDFSNAEKLKDAFTDKHDNAEDANFFEPGTKKQLQATLAEMWKAEMRLRTFMPQTALPSEYKALRLLKDLQQQSRAYVAKASFKTAPLDLKKRLTGELSRIDATLLQKDTRKEEDPQLAVRSALAVLETIKTGDTSHTSSAILQQAAMRLHEKAAQQPGIYLPAVAALKKITYNIETGKPIAGNDMLAAQYGLQQLLLVPGRLPRAGQAASAQTLAKQYFENLKKWQP